MFIVFESLIAPRVANNVMPSDDRNATIRDPSALFISLIASVTNSYCFTVVPTSTIEHRRDIDEGQPLLVGNIKWAEEIQALLTKWNFFQLPLTRI